MVKAGAWAALQNGFAGILQFGGAIILSRLVSPEEFGLLALVMVFYSVSAQIINGSLANATIQKENLSVEQASNLFWVSTGLSAIGALVITALGPLLATVYRHEELQSIAVVMGLLLLLDGMFAQHKALLMRNMRFDLLFVATLIPGFVGLGIAVAMAVSGYGVWALLAQLVANSIVSRLVLFLLIPWSPGAYVKGAGIRSMLSFGGKSSLGQTTSIVESRLSVLVLGAFADPVAVGFLNRGQSLFDRPLSQVLRPLGMTLLPSMSRLQNDRPALQELIAGVYWTIAFLTGGLLCWVLFSGRDIALLLLGSPWREAGVVMQWFALGGVCRILSLPISRANASCGRPARAVSVQIIMLPVTLTGIIYFAQFGAGAVAAVISLSQVVKLPFVLYLGLKGLELDSRLIIGTIVSIIVCLAAACALQFYLPLGEGNVISLLTKLAVAQVSIFGCMLLFAGGRGAIQMACSQIRHFLSVSARKVMPQPAA